MSPPERSIAIIGAGLGGLCMAARLRQQGSRNFQVFEKADGVGGTWRDNRYPGVACDVPSHLYSFSFALNPDWSHAYSPGPEILAYAQRCAREAGLEQHLHFGTEIRQCRYEHGRWQLKTSSGEVFTADVLISAMGGLHHPSVPDIPGADGFAGTAFHSARWRQGHDLQDQDVALIGSAASAIQIVPAIAAQVRSLTVYQRTPNWILPRRDRAYSAFTRRLLATLPGVARAYRWLLYCLLESRWPAFLRRLPFNQIVRWMGKRHIEAQVPDSHLREQLTPAYPPGCKRILLSDDFYPALLRDNVRLETRPIERIDAQGIVVEDNLQPATTIVYATGFDVNAISRNTEILGSDGTSLEYAWRNGIAAHRSVSVPGFPNLFLLLGPNSGVGHNSALFMIETQVEYVLDCLRQMDARGWSAMDVRPAAFQQYREEITRRLQRTIWTAGCKSWYQDPEGHVFALWPQSTTSFWRSMRRANLAEYTAVEINPDLPG